MALATRRALFLRPGKGKPLAPYGSHSIEKDACGIGFVADAEGRASRTVVDDALDALARVRHRGAVAADARSGDGAGLLLPLPRHILTAARPDAPPERLGVAMIFTWAPLEDARQVVAAACQAEGLDVVAWRGVPTDPRALGDHARRTAPLVEQAVVARPPEVADDEGERAAFRARRRVEAFTRRECVDVYVSSLSFRTVTYKALCAADRLSDFYPDLADAAYAVWFALFHQRYATNTEPTWARAQPFRLTAHNGEINTIRGNVSWMQARATRLGSRLPAPPELLAPVLDPAGSDSAQLDETLELLVRGGRDVEHAVTMLMPPAWEDARDAGPSLTDFLDYHACMIEPWDGPAGLVFADGRRVGAALDRNGLRPLRLSTCDDGFVACASEAGAIATSGHGRVRRTRLGAGELVVVDPERGGVDEDIEVKRRLSLGRPYSAWLDEHLERRGTGAPVEPPTIDVTPRQIAAGYTKEEVTVVLRPMAAHGVETTSSMGDDTPQPPLATHARPVFSFLKQRFAQVTNPPIDHLRERHVMSLRTRIGARGALLDESPRAAALLHYDSFVLYPDELERLERDGAAVIDATFDIADGPDGLQKACDRADAEATHAVLDRAAIVVVSHRELGPERVAVPSALAAGAIHHGLLRRGARLLASIVVDCDDAREPHHAACLLANGADAVCPRLALQSVAAIAAAGRLGADGGAAVAQRRYVAAMEAGVLKIMSKMGVAVLDSYRGAQLIEAIGLGSDVIDLCFEGITSPVGGLSFVELGADAILRHAAAFSDMQRPALSSFGQIKFKKGGEYHALNPEVVEALQASVHVDDPDVQAAHALARAVKGNEAAYETFVALSDGRPPSQPRDLLEPIPAGPPVPLDEVEPASAIARRFSTGAMSHGALSAEAHETIAIALHLIGGRANTGEGGEAPERYRDERNSKIKQVASGRFGVTPEYIAFAQELQIKMAQGSKPGEGGQLPGKKVTAEIARLRHTVPGVGLISPPPHHDIYSIEDLAQLVYDLKQANPVADVSVKLVASEGVGTVAAGVVKGSADVVHIAGADGGTGASPLSSIRYAGMPWEIGLADAQATLAAAGLRGRVRLRVDGGLKTGRDVLLAALLGADEFSFGTAALIAEGCILVRTCHRNTCPVGIATQDPELRARFSGTPAMVASYLMLVAEEVRRLLAAVGLSSLEEAVGRTDMLRQGVRGDAGVDAVDLAPLISPPATGERRFTGRLPIQQPRDELGDALHRAAFDRICEGDAVELDQVITTASRAFGARLGVALAARFGMRKPPGRVTVKLNGHAGQSFGAFLSDGIHLVLTGEANDYVGKSMGGGKIAIAAPDDDAGDPVLVGNTVLYGATGGQLFVAGRAGERFAVRNSGAVAVVEGTGDHACEYMTAGAVVILGPTGRNLGAGMSGGEAYVFDPDGLLRTRMNPQLVAAYEPTFAQLASLKRVIERHAAATRSSLARSLLDDWERRCDSFVRVAPVTEVQRLEALDAASAADERFTSGDPLVA